MFYCTADARYWDILPNPITRVRLPILDNDPKTEYVLRATGTVT